MRERYEIETVEQLRAIADLLRLRIIEMLEKRAMTVTQLGEELGLAPAKVHYHVRELERVGLLELVETREKGGILEKYYQPIAREISVHKALLSAPSDEAQSMLRAFFNQITDGYLQAFRKTADEPETSANKGRINLVFSHLYMTLEEQRNLAKQVDELSSPFSQKRGIEGEQEIVFATVAYPAGVPEAKQPEETPSTRISWMAGVVGYNRKDLLKARRDGVRLRISVIGICHFANDIDAALADEVIWSFKLVGKLTASPEVREVLKRKEGQEEHGI